MLIPGYKDRGKMKWLITTTSEFLVAEATDAITGLRVIITATYTGIIIPQDSIPTVERVQHCTAPPAPEVAQVIVSPIKVAITTRKTREATAIITNN